MISSFKIKRISKWVLLLSAFMIGATILWFTNNLVDDLRREERTKVNIWANATKQTTDIDNLDEDIRHRDAAARYGCSQHTENAEGR